MARTAAAGSVVFYRQQQYYLHTQAATLAQTLAEITRQTAVEFHYAVLPEQPVSAVCSAKGLVEIVKCLVAGRLTVSFRRMPGQKNAVSDIWLSGSTLAAAGALTDCQPDTTEPVQKKDYYFRQLESGDVAARKVAMIYLSAHIAMDDERFNQRLEQLLQDEAVGIRVQALTSLVSRLGEQAAEQALRLALQDDNPGMRLAALQLIHHHQELLEQAVNDEDARVRQMAAMKLQQQTAETP